MNALPPSKQTVVDITDEMHQSYLDYAMSVIVSRALPDARDGLKPVHRRILHAMREGGYTHGKPFRKSARIVGDVMGKYHPHGDSAIYDAMVRMAQGFSMRLPLIDGQGNFGSIDGDPAAAMRYTEARLTREAALLLDDIEKDTVNFQDNYDGSVQEPTVIPARLPNLLINGCDGIAVGMATRIPPHNVKECIDGCLALLENPALTAGELMHHIPGPDFPTGGIIMGRAGIRQAYETGNGSITMRSRHHVEAATGNRKAIVFTEIPFQVNKAKLHQQIVEMVQEKKILGISSVRDESDREGIRLVVELKRDAEENLVLAQIFKHTNAETNFSANMLALDHDRPQRMGIKRLLEIFLAFRREVIRRRTAFDLRKARDRAHIVAGQLAALAETDRIIKLIRAAGDPASAREALMNTDLEVGDVASLLKLADPKTVLVSRRGKTYYRLTEIQARAILELRLHHLTSLERDKLTEEAKDLAARIERFLDILNNAATLTAVLREELVEVGAKLNQPRRTAIEDSEAEYEIEDLIAREDMVVTLTYSGYVKRVPLDAYRSQKHGGKGRNGMDTKDTDFVTQVITSSTHTPLLVFTSRGMVYRLKVYQLPEGTPTGRGRPIVNVLPLERDDRIIDIIALPEDEADWEGLTLAFVTENGNMRRNSLGDFSNIRKSGLIAMKLEDKDGKPFDSLINVLVCQAEREDIMISTAEGMVIRFPATDVRIFSGRTSTGVRGIRLGKGDRVISAITLTHIDAQPAEFHAYLAMSAAGAPKTGRNARNDAPVDGEAAIVLDAERFSELRGFEQMILTVTSNGFGKRTSSYAYRVTARGGKGVRDRSTHNKVGQQVRSIIAASEGEVVLVTDGGQLIRMPTDKIRITGRGAAGVRLIRLADTEQVVSLAPVVEDEPRFGDEQLAIELAASQDQKTTE